ncbi:hypothetical protein AB0M68_20410 [Streptomyces sp. NPDC051453]|uniref:hypothetical protein n=1 Tax=Streptomyces sp. NPDC051453 TaxID=3154941 RepID=UPI00341536A6
MVGPAWVVYWPTAGPPLGELWNLSALALDCRTTNPWDSLPIVKPLNLTGGVGTPANAITLR